MGSVPFTRSIDYQGVTNECSKSAVIYLPVEHSLNLKSVVERPFHRPLAEPAAPKKRRLSAEGLANIRAGVPKRMAKKGGRARREPPDTSSFLAGASPRKRSSQTVAPNHAL